MASLSTNSFSMEAPTDAECTVVGIHVIACDDETEEEMDATHGGNVGVGGGGAHENPKKDTTDSSFFLRLAIFVMLIGLLGLLSAAVSIVHDKYPNHHVGSGGNANQSQTMTFSPSAESCKITCDSDNNVSLPVDFDPMLLTHYENLQRELVSIGALSFEKEGEQYECSSENQALWQMALDRTHDCSFFSSESSFTVSPLNVTSITNRFVMYTLYASLGKLESHPDLHEHVCVHGSIICYVNEEIMFLDMSNMDLRGSIPTQIAMLTSLRLLDLSTNFLTGTIWEDTFNNMNHLMMLRLTNNQFSGNLPSNLFRIPSLTRIEVSHNRFSGPLLTTSESLPSSDLEKLDISHNQFTGTVPDFNPCCGNLRYLSVASNDFYGEVSLDQLPIRTLTHLFLKNNHLLDLNNLKLNHLLELEAVSLAGENVPLPEPQKLPKLQHLDAASCHLTGTVPQTIWAPNLRFLNLSDNVFFGEIDWDHVDDNAHSLDLLDLSWNDLSGTVQLHDSHIGLLHVQGNTNLSLYDPIDFCAHRGYCHALCLGDMCDD